MEAFFSSSVISWETAALRLIVSFLLSMVIGLERQAHNQPAGLRTHILICVGATVIMLISLEIPLMFGTGHTGDPGRIAAQVVSGIGFLGAGAIMRYGGNVRGLTTAASIWAMAAVGLAVGAGLFIIAVIGVAVMFFVLSVLGFIEDRYLGDRLMKKIDLVIKKKNSDIEQIRKSIEKMKIRVNSSGFECNTAESTIRVTFLAMVPSNFNIQRLSDCFDRIEGVMAFSVESVG